MAITDETKTIWENHLMNELSVAGLTVAQRGVLAVDVVKHIDIEGGPQFVYIPNLSNIIRRATGGLSYQVNRILEEFIHDAEHGNIFG